MEEQLGDELPPEDGFISFIDDASLQDDGNHVSFETNICRPAGHVFMVSYM